MADRGHQPSQRHQPVLLHEAVQIRFDRLGPSFDALADILGDVANDIDHLDNLAGMVDQGVGGHLGNAHGPVGHACFVHPARRPSRFDRRIHGADAVLARTGLQRIVDRLETVAADHRFAPLALGDQVCIIAVQDSASLQFRIR